MALTDLWRTLDRLKLAISIRHKVQVIAIVDLELIPKTNYLKGKIFSEFLLALVTKFETLLAEKSSEKIYGYHVCKTQSSHRQTDIQI